MTTVPFTRLPTGYFSSTFSQGLADFCFSPRPIFSLLAIDVQDLHLDFLIDRHHLRRVADAAPAHVGDVQQAVDAPQVDERAELGDVLDRALADLAGFQLGQQLRPSSRRVRSSISARRLTTMLRRASSIFSTTHWIVRPM